MISIQLFYIIIRPIDNVFLSRCAPSPNYRPTFLHKRVGIAYSFVVDYVTWLLTDCDSIAMNSQTGSYGISTREQSRRELAEAKSNVKGLIRINRSMQYSYNYLS